MQGTHEPSDHERRPEEKPPALGTFSNEFELEVCVCGARRFADLSGEPATGWFIWASKSRQNPL